MLWKVIDAFSKLAGLGWLLVAMYHSLYNQYDQAAVALGWTIVSWMVVRGENNA